jgi:hypothetical protein
VGLVVAVTAFFHRLLDPGEILFRRDGFRLLVPLRMYLVERLSAGEFPLWYPYDALGRPYIDTAVTGVFHPYTLVFLLLDPHNAYKAVVLLTCILGAVGGFFLARRLGASAPGALVAGLVQALAGYSVSMTENLVYLFAPSVLPVLLLAVEAAATSRRALVAVAALLASPFLIGDPQGGLLFGVLAVGWAGWRQGWSLVGKMAIAALLAVLLAAAQLVPMWFAFRSSSRADSSAFRTESVRWSTSPQRLFQLIASPGSDAFEEETIAQGLFESGARGYWARSIYLGLGALGLALVALGRRWRGLWPLGALAAAFLVLALGQHGVLYELFYRFVPLWSAFRYPEKMLGFATAPLALLAGLGLDCLAERSRSWGWWLAAGLAAGGAVWLGADAQALSVKAGWVAFAHAASGALGWSAVTAAALGGLSLLVGRGLVRPTLASVGGAAVVLFDLARGNGQAYRTAPRELADLMPPLVESLRRAEGPYSLGRYRLATFRDARVSFPRSLGEQMGSQDAQTVAVRNSLDQEFNAVFHLESPGAYLPAEQAQLKAVIIDKAPLGTLGHYNVKYLIGSGATMKRLGVLSQVVGTLPPFDLVLTGNPAVVKPRAYLATKAQSVSGPEDWSSLTRRDEFQKGELDYVELDGATLPSELGHGPVQMERYQPERVELSYSTSRPGLLVLSDSFDSGWEAQLDEAKSLKILRTNGLVRGVVVPEGAHRVVFRYRPTRVYVGVAVSLLGLVLSGVLLTLRRDGETARRMLRVSDSLTFRAKVR